MSIRIKTIRFNENCSQDKPAYMCRLEGEKRWRNVYGMNIGHASYPWIAYKGERLRFIDMDVWVGNSPDMWREWEVLEDPILWYRGRPLYREDLIRMRYIRLGDLADVDKIRRAGFHVLSEDDEGLYYLETFKE